MKIDDAIRTSLRGVRQAKVRSVLTMLGIVIGIASVILLMSIGASAQQLILDQVKNVGSNLIFVIPGGSGGSKYASPASVQGIIIKTLTQRDADAISKEPTVVGVAPVVRGQARAVFESNDVTVSWQGSTADFFAISKLDVERGYPFSYADVLAYNRVIVLGSELAKTLFGQRDPIGKSIRLKDVSFRVVGVLAPKGVGAFGIDQDSTAIIPLTVGQKQLLGIDYYNSMSIQAADAYDIEFTKARVTSILRQNHRITGPVKDDFTIRTQEDALATLGSITTVMTLFLTCIAAISLVVGGIGIMNIMLVSVVERTKEIGLRKALGATERDILQQFLVESVILTFIGGIIGMAVGIGGVVLAFAGIKYGAGLDWSLQIPLSAVGLALGVSVLTGVAFGVYPARQAARKNPIEALRYE